MPESTPINTNAVSAASALKAINAKLWNEMVTSQREAIEFLWKNPHATAQQICDQLGTTAVMHFDDHAALTQLIAERAAACGIQQDISFPTYAFTRNPDGTVTIHEGTPYEL